MAPSWHIRGAVALVARQSIGNEVNNVKSTLGSWDSCMSKAYCKWPVIAAIIVGALIVCSILFCVVRCCCCGLDCCCGMCSCCNACCGGRRNRKDYQPAPQQPMYPPPGWGPQQQGPVPWQPQPQPLNTMMYGGAAGMPHQPPAPSVATFESAPKLEKSGASVKTAARSGEDQLPAMPSWAGATEHHVEDTTPQAAEEKGAARAQESLPLQDPRRPSPGPAAAAAYTDNIPLQDRRSPPARSQTQSPGYESQYGQGTEYAPSTLGSQHGYDAPTMAYGAGAGAGLAAAGLAAAGHHHHAEKPPLNTAISNPAAFARLPHSPGHTSPVSPQTPAASSVYSANPPPSYHTNVFAGPSVRRPPPGARSPPPPAPPAPQRVQSPYQAYTPYSPTGAASPATPASPAPAYQPYNPFGAAPAPAPAELGGNARAEMGGNPRSELGGGSAAWGEGPARRPAPGWREV